MAIVNPIFSSFIVSQKEKKCVYTCPGGSSGATVNIVCALENVEPIIQPAYVNIYLSSVTSDPKENEYLMVNVPMGLREYSPRLSEIYVGPGQSLHVEVKEGTSSKVSVVTSGHQTDDDTMLTCGSVYNTTSTTKGMKELYFHNNPLSSGFDGTVSVSSFDKATKVYFYVSKDKMPAGSTLPVNNPAYVGMMDLKPNETVFGEDIKLPNGYRLSAFTNVEKLTIVLNGFSLSKS